MIGQLLTMQKDINKNLRIVDIHKIYNLVIMRHLNLPPYERKRVQNINFVMNDLYSLLPTIYENLMDKDYNAVRRNVSEFSRTLKGVSDSVREEA